MNKLFKKFNIRFKSILHQMLASFGLVILFIVIIAAVAIGSSWQASSEVDYMIQDRVPGILTFEELSENFTARNKVVYEYIVTGNEARESEFAELTEESHELENDLLTYYDNEAAHEVVELAGNWTEAVETEVLAQTAAGNELIASTNMDSLNGQTSTINTIYEENLEVLENELFAMGEEIDASQRLVIIVTAVLGIVAIIISIAIAWFSSKGLTKRIDLMKNRLEEFTQEDFSSAPLEVESEDEIGDLANSLNATQQYLLNLMHNIRTTADILAESSQDFTNTGSEVMMGSSQIAATMQELASGSEAQANSASNLASDMDLFSDQTKEALEYGEEVNKGAEGIVTTAEEGQEYMKMSDEQMQSINNIVQEAVSQMDILNTQTSEISNLVDIINDIASQTNLLALNASIEAARAGEQGRGFAVVADEVRKLAEGVADSVTEITTYVDHVQEDAEKVSSSLESVSSAVEVGTGQIAATEEKVNGILTSIHDMKGKNEQTSVNLKNIATQSQEMNTMVDEIASVSEESAAGVEETSASVEEIDSSIGEINERTAELASIAHDLNELIKHVKINQSQTEEVVEEDLNQMPATLETP